MSNKHPIIAVTGSSGSGTSTARKAFMQLFQQEGIKAAFIQGDGFHRYTRSDMERLVEEAIQDGDEFSHFGARANHFDKLESLFKDYSESGEGESRRYLHNFSQSAAYHQEPGTFTHWESIPENTDILFYEGLHGGVVTDEVNVAQYVDLLIGMTPTINLEWIQKINRDTRYRGYSHNDVIATLLRRMGDYIRYITPQFSRTHINFQRVPIVDTSNPFNTDSVPTADETLVAIHFRKIKEVDFPYYLRMIAGSFMSEPRTIVIPGSKMNFAVELMLAPLVQQIMSRKKNSTESIQPIIKGAEQPA